MVKILYRWQFPVMKSRVLITLPLPTAALDALKQQFDVQIWDQGPMPKLQIAQRAKTTDAILCSLGTSITSDLIRSNPQLRTISSISVGVDHIDMAAATAASLPIGHTPDVLVDSTADLALALMLAATRRIVEADRFVREGHWSADWTTDFFLGTDLSRATIGIVGLGPTGLAVVKRVRAFGAKVIGWNRTEREVPGVRNVALDDLFAEADIVSVHTAAAPETHHLVSANRLALMKPGAVIINTARGSVIDESALIVALSKGKIRAGLDVYEQEPLAKDSPLLALDNVVLMPHLGSATAATRQAMMERACANLIAGLDGKPLPWCANPEVYAGG
ncbi:MAG: D-glycerate dehydrogenase [Luminiphilus sp.]|nr:D-glycerate dehydrogenase [Luminiphilus sp.]